jgi:hypothetical protein
LDAEDGWDLLLEMLIALELGANDIRGHHLDGSIAAESTWILVSSTLGLRPKSRT